MPWLYPSVRLSASTATSKVSFPCPGHRGEQGETTFWSHAVHNPLDVLSSCHPHTLAPLSSYQAWVLAKWAAVTARRSGGPASLTHVQPPAPRERWHTRTGEPGWHPEATAALPPGRTPAVLFVLPGERTSASRTARAPALDPAGEGISGLGRLEVKGCVRWVLCPPPALSPHGVLRSSLGWDPGTDSALHRLTAHLFFLRGRCSPSYGNAAARGPWMWRRWAQGGPRTTCSGSFTLVTDTSTVSVPHGFCGGEGCSGGWGSTASPRRGGRQGPRADQDKTSGSGLSLSLGLLPTENLLLFYLLSFPFPCHPENLGSADPGVPIQRSLSHPFMPCPRGENVARLDAEGRELSILPQPTDWPPGGLGAGQCFFLGGANCSLTPLEPEPFSNRLLMRGAIAGVGGASEKGETFSLGLEEGGAERRLSTGGSCPTWLYAAGPH